MPSSTAASCGCAATIGRRGQVGVTITSTVPDPGGDITVSWVPVLLVMLARADPNSTVEPVKFAPLIVTVVPPAAGPDVGLIEVIVGGMTLFPGFATGG